MTPAQHKTAAETALANLDASSFTHGDYDAAQAHAHLSKALGTGTHYTEADAALASYDAQRTGVSTMPPLSRDRLAREALLRAVLADR